MRIAVYSVLYGNREPFNPHCLRAAEGYDRFVFTDREELDTDATVITEATYALDPKRASSRAKLCPYRYFADYDWTIYLDNIAKLLTDPGEIVQELRSLGNASFFCFAHGGRDCIYEEAKVCIRRGLDNPGIIRRQMKAYAEDGFPAHAGLLQGTFLVRKMADKQWEKAGERWFEQVLRYSRRDQLSFNYVAWKLGLEPRYLPGNINQNDYVQWPVVFRDGEFCERYRSIPRSTRKCLKRALGRLGILGWIRGRSH